MKRSLRWFWLVVLLGSAVTAAGRPEGRVRIFLVGDSTMADKPVVDNPERGWGQVFPWFFDDGVTVINHARNGRSTKSFIAEGKWNDVVAALNPGDYVLIQFGHNDAKKEDSTRFADAQTDYRRNLHRFVADARAKGALPVLLTPVNRRKFDDADRFVDQHGDYPVVVREVANEDRVPLIDLHQRSLKLFERLGPEGTKRLFLWVDAGTYRLLPDGKQDNTHFTKTGALAVARLVVDGIRELSLPLASHLPGLDPEGLVGLGKRVALDYWYNHEIRQNAAGLPEQYHYIWEDTTNSGFSDLGRVIDRLGANITSVRTEPSGDDLRHASVYVIVDPDTPLESPVPHYLSDSAAARIAGWVHSGGVLVLLANDSGNTEFAHLNGLARRFGMTFDENSHHRVSGKNFDMGKFGDLPDHPIFAGVRQIYMKEICSIGIRPPAHALLTEQGRAFVAEASFGTGLVLAVGDPWLYNEYLDGRKLPAEYENGKAGANLFRWLCERSHPVE